eukprot:gene5062-6329_t
MYNAAPSGPGAVLRVPEYSGRHLHDLSSPQGIRCRDQSLSRDPRSRLRARLAHAVRAARPRLGHGEMLQVAGPNGSGKSNVVDSIKWVLGDQSPKSLRGKEMTDVIFNGSGGRKPAGYAEATLTFDNSKNLLNVDTHEVQIGRRIYRSGEAEYLINRSPVRLKDVKDLFLGTGAGTSAYSIIEQGRVDALLQ